jgi:regulator of replication initiation timing
MPLNEIDLNQIKDEGLRTLVGELLNIIEEQSTHIRQLETENQTLRGEINRLKGEQGQPDIKASKQEKPADHSSERERKPGRKRKKRRTKAEISIDREEVLRVDRTDLPEDVVSKGYQEHIVQDIRIETDNVRFWKEKLYSPGTGKTYLAALPPGYRGDFGPTLRAQVLSLYYVGHMTEPRILTWLEDIGIVMSGSTLSAMLIKGHEALHQEEAESFRAGLAVCPYQHLDETGTRVDGHNQYCHIVDNPFMTHFRTTPGKSRLDVLDVLRDSPDRLFRLNGEAFDLLARLNTPEKAICQLMTLPQDTDLTADFMDAWLDVHLPSLNDPTRRALLSALAIAAYHTQTDIPVVRLLVCDDAAQFKLITDELALCWVHEGRHYKKLMPTIPYHQRLLERFLTAFWRFYHRLKDYQLNPTPEVATRLDRHFDRLFSLKTSYEALNELIARTRNHKAQLLLALTHPDLPLHNNPAELGARQRVRKRKISFGPRVPDGVRAWDTFGSLVATTHKLGISFHRFVLDRLRGGQEIPPLPDIIYERGHALKLGASG